MSKTTAPLLSFDARGQIGQTLVYASWKGRPYARRYVVPSNPNSTAQQATRNVFRTLNRIWQYMPGGALGAWNAYAENSRITPRNGFIKQNLSNVRGDADLADWIASVSANGGIAADGVSVAAGVGELTVTVTAPTLPTGWSVTQAHALAILDYDPATDAIPEITAGTDATDPYEITLTGLTGGSLYRVGGWLEYTKPDGSTAYGSAIMDSGTPT